MTQLPILKRFAESRQFWRNRPPGECYPECSFNVVEDILQPKRLADLTTERVAYLQAMMRQRGLSESTIKSHAAHLKAALRWAAKMKMLRLAPDVEMPKRATDKMKGRPVTLEEFERMLAAVPKVIKGEANIRDWRLYLRGLWASGLRLRESTELYWDRNDRLRVDLDGRRPMLWIPAALDKGGKARLLPASPEFAEILQAVPEAERRGRVFRLDGPQGPLGSHRVSILARRIGKAAGVIVEPAKGDKQAALCRLPRPAAFIRRTLGHPRDAAGADGINAAREHRDDAEILRGP